MRTGSLPPTSLTSGPRSSTAPLGLTALLRHRRRRCEVACPTQRPAGIDITTGARSRPEIRHPTVRDRHIPLPGGTRLGVRPFRAACHICPWPCPWLRLTKHPEQLELASTLSTHGWTLRLLLHRHEARPGASDSLCSSFRAAQLNMHGQPTSVLRAH